jgi:hypothetical protein
VRDVALSKVSDTTASTSMNRSLAVSIMILPD